MSMKRFMKSMMLTIICFCMAGACCGTTFGENTGAESAAPATAYLAELYEKTSIDQVYKLTNVDTEGYAVGDAYLKDGYVLLLMHDYSEEGFEGEFGVEHMMPSGKLLLFPLLHPEEAISRDVEQFQGQYGLLSGGRVINVDWSGDFTIFDSKLEEVQKANLACREVLGSSDDGDIWVVTENSELVLYREGEAVKTIFAEGAVSGSFLCEREGKAYFSLYDEWFNSSLISVNLTDDSIEKLGFLTISRELAGEWINYGSEDRWYLADIEDPYTVTVFDKPFSNEYLWKLDDNYLIGTSAYLDEAENYRQKIRVYDRKNGGLCADKRSTDLAGEELLLYDYDQGIVLYGDTTPDLETKGLYLWDLNGLEAACPAEYYEVVDYHVDQERIDSMIQEIHDLYGVTIYYDQAHLDECGGTYALSEIEDKELLGFTLIRLQECMAEYPEGFFAELTSGAFDSVVYYLSGRHEKIFEDTIDEAAATVSFRDDVLQMTIDANYWWELRRTFLHENMHMIDNVLEDKCSTLFERNIFDYWYKVMNDPEIGSMQQYNYEESEENLKGVYSYDTDPEEAWYIDSYSKSTMSEDRARILENSIYSSADEYFVSSHIDRKARCINALIRDVFACVKNSEEPVLWEARTGIVDLREEFPDFQ